MKKKILLMFLILGLSGISCGDVNVSGTDLENQPNQANEPNQENEPSLAKTPDDQLGVYSGKPSPCTTNNICYVTGNNGLTCGGTGDIEFSTIYNDKTYSLNCSLSDSCLACSTEEVFQDLCSDEAICWSVGTSGSICNSAVGNCQVDGCIDCADVFYRD